MRKDPVAPSPLAQKQAAPRVDRGKQADPVVWTGARVEVQWSMGRDKDRKVGVDIWQGECAALPDNNVGRQVCCLCSSVSCSGLQRLSRVLSREAAPRTRTS